MFERFLLITLVGVASAFIQSRPDSEVISSPPKTVPSVNLNRYGGVWYEIASVPILFQKGCINTKATYTLQEDRTIKVNNYCQNNGKALQVNGTATVEDITGSKLKVQFPFSGLNGLHYWIVRLGEDYQYAVVSQPNYRYIWILYRKPVMPQGLYNLLIESLSKDGYPVRRIKRTLQKQQIEGDDRVVSP